MFDAKPGLCTRVAVLGVLEGIENFSENRSDVIPNCFSRARSFASNGFQVYAMSLCRIVKELGGRLIQTRSAPPSSTNVSKVLSFYPNDILLRLRLLRQGCFTLPAGCPPPSSP